MATGEQLKAVRAVGVSKVGYSWERTKASTNNRVPWRAPVDTLCSRVKRNGDDDVDDDNDVACNWGGHAL